MRAARPWRAILEGDARERALAAVDAVAADLLRPSAAWIPGAEAELFRRRRGASLAHGRAGLAVFYGYLARAGHRLGEHDPLDVAEARLDEAADVLAELPMPFSLYRGLSGIAWAGEHLRRLFGEEEGTDEDDPNAEIDAALVAGLADEPAFDLWHGLVGLGVYALERLPRPSARALLADLVVRLEATAETTDAGVLWRTLPAALDDRRRSIYPRGLYYLGLAHGLAGVIVFLARVVAAGIAIDRARPLLDAAVARLLAERRDPAGGTGFYPPQLGFDGTPGGRLNAWCQGDLGVALAFCLAGRTVDEPAWEEEGLIVARHAAGLLADPGMAADAGLCHGAAGFGHLFHRLYQWADDDTCADATRRWLGRVLEHRHPGRGPGGFAAWGYGPDGDLGERYDPGIVQGAAGVALALLAAATDLEPAWDRMMLLSA